jgi:hypothetical protein
MEVKNEIMKDMQSADTINLAFDGLSCGADHTIATFASYTCVSNHDSSSNRGTDNREVMLSLKYLPIAGNQTSANHHQLLLRICATFGITSEQLLAYEADNCAAMRAIAPLFRPMLSCSSHRLNLGIQEFLALNPIKMKCLRLIHRLMKQLKKPNVGSILSQLSRGTFKPILHNKTRWSSKYNILKRYFKLEDSNLLSRPEMDQLISLISWRKKSRSSTRE